MYAKRLSLLLIVMSLAISCHRHIPQTEPGEEGFYHSLNLKLNIELRNENRKGSGKILWFFDGSRGKMLFLSPLNQVYYELFVEREHALLISRKEKKYWKGSFSNLLKGLWNIEVKYHQLMALVNEGKIPPKTGLQQQLVFNIDKGQESGQPTKIEISGHDVTLKFKIARKKTRQGRLKFTPKLAALQRVGIKEILSLQY